MKTVVAVYTSQGNVAKFTADFKEKMPDVRLITIVDDSLIPDVIQAGRVTEKVVRRLLHYYMAAEYAAPDLIINMCSSVGEVVYMGRQMLAHVPILRIDEPMAWQAVRRYSRIGAMATLPTTLAPTANLLRKAAAEADREIEVIEGLAEGAYQALRSGSPEKHDELIISTAASLADRVDAFVLAQGSMERSAPVVAEKTGKPVLSSPGPCIEHVAELLKG